MCRSSPIQAQYSWARMHFKQEIEDFVVEQRKAGNIRSLS
jgi:hypothetical protein